MRHITPHFFRGLLHKFQVFNNLTTPALRTIMPSHHHHSLHLPPPLPLCTTPTRRPPSLFPLPLPSSFLPTSSLLRPQPLQLPLQHLLQRLIPPRQQHNILSINNLSPAVLGKELKILGRVLDLCVDELGQGTDELRCRVEGLGAFVVDELSDCVPEGGFEAL